jgi:AAA ATPase domain
MRVSTGVPATTAAAGKKESGMDGPSQIERGASLASLVRSAPPFVGRRQELDWLAHRLQEVRAGHPRVVLIPGEAGIGKTRLVQESLSLALHHGVRVGHGRCYEAWPSPTSPLSRPGTGS